MKKNIFLLFVLLINNIAWCQLTPVGMPICNGCAWITPPGPPPPKNPNINYCYGGLDRYLARSIAMDGLTDLITLLPWSSECNDPNYACNHPYSDCPSAGGYCPDRFCQDLQLLIDFKAAFIRRVAGLWGSESKLSIGANYYNNLPVVVNEINYKYDCQSMERPIIQAAILEHISSDVNGIQIPSWVLLEFSSDPDFSAAGYVPTGTYNFNVNQIGQSIVSTGGGNFEGVPDLAKIQTRMWYYYLARTYLNAGFRALHMGDIVKVTNNDPGYTKTYDLFQRIRSYAVTLSYSPFVVIDAHTSQDVYLNGTGTLLLDFNSSPIRPDEMPPSGGCSLWASMAANTYAPGVLFTVGGASPTSCSYSQTPVVFEFDHHAGICGTPGSATHSGWCPWGYDEANWLNAMTQSCQSTWVGSATCLARSMNNTRAYLQMPGRLVLNPWPNSVYRIVDNPILYNNIKNNVWGTITTPNISIDETCVKTTSPCFPSGYLKGNKEYRLRVTNPDCSSVYTWHAYNSTYGFWLPFTFGTERILSTVMPGTYDIYLRQDNLGLPASNNVIQKKITLYLDQFCCKGQESPSWGDWTSLYSGPGFRSTKNIENLVSEVINNKIINQNSLISKYDNEDDYYNNNYNSHGISIVPNPSSGEFQIISSDYQAEIKIIDAQGKVLHQQTLQGFQNRIDLHAVPNGVYVLHYKCANATSIHKIIIQR